MHRALPHSACHDGCQASVQVFHVHSCKWSSPSASIGPCSRPGIEPCWRADALQLLHSNCLLCQPFNPFVNRFFIGRREVSTSWNSARPSTTEPSTLQRECPFPPQSKSRSVNFLLELALATISLSRSPHLVVPLQPDRTFTISTGMPPSSYLLKKAAGIEKGSSTPGERLCLTTALSYSMLCLFLSFLALLTSRWLPVHAGRTSAGKVTLRQIYEIAKVKHQDPKFRHSSLQGVCRSLIGSCRTMGIDVV